jgi:hypothetical protein
MKFLFAILMLSAPLASAEPDRLEQVFDRMYRHDFSGAQSLIKAYIERNPSEPLGYGVRTATYLFPELDRLKILEAEFFGDDKRILEKQKPKPDPQVRAGLFESVEKTRKLSAAALASNPRDTNALFAMCIAMGVQTDYVALVEKRQVGSLSLARDSHNWALKLLAADPNFYDAYLTTGLSEYLTGSVPFFVRWFLRFDHTQGSKAQAVKNLSLVAEKGRYFRPFAKVLLAIIHLREKRPMKAEILMASLAREFPENPLFQKELAKLVNRRQILGNGGSK